MKHFAESSFWNCYRKLPKSIQQLADKNFDLLKIDHKHPSLHLKRVTKEIWSVRVGINYRGLATQNEEGNLIWFWIGSHSDYDKMMQ